jgi:hypothetical protein
MGPSAAVTLGGGYVRVFGKNQAQGLAIKFIALLTEEASVHVDH